LRRRFFTLLVACALVSGCSRISTQTHAGAGNPWTVHGVLRMASTRTPATLNTLLATQAVETDLSMLWAGYLFNYDDRGNFIPELATEVPTLHNGGISRDGLAIAYHLRKGVRWQDGAPFTADDIIFSWHVIMNPNVQTLSRNHFDRIASIQKIDDYTIVVHLRQRHAPFVSSFFTLSDHTMAVLPKHLLERVANINRAAYNDMPVGTGPFRIVKNDKGSLIKFVANPSYWRGAPKLREIDVHIIPNDNTIVTMLRTHDIDVYLRASEAQVPSLAGIPGTRIEMYPFTRFADLGFNGASPPLSDRRVRQALAYGTNREQLIAKVTHGVNIPGDSDQPPFFWAHADGLPQYPYDPNRAAALLDAAGWHLGPNGMRTKNGEPLTLTLVGTTGVATMANTETIVQQEWKQLGVDVLIKNFPSGLLYATKAGGGIEQNGKFDVALEEWANGTDPDDSVLFLCRMRPPEGWNIYHFCNGRFDAAMNDAATQYDPARRKADYAVTQRILTDELPVFILWYARRVDVVNSDLKNYRPAHAVTPFWNPWEWAI
jgi:peptide/nickel transport system substrate-binding protein